MKSVLIRHLAVMEQKFDAALPYERREKLRASRHRQWCRPFLKFPSAREHFRLLPTRAEDESRARLPTPNTCSDPGKFLIGTQWAERVSLTKMSAGRNTGYTQVERPKKGLRAGGSLDTAFFSRPSYNQPPIEGLYPPRSIEIPIHQEASGENLAGGQGMVAKMFQVPVPFGQTFPPGSSINSAAKHTGANTMLPPNLPLIPYSTVLIRTSFPPPLSSNSLLEDGRWGTQGGESTVATDSQLCKDLPSSSTIVVPATRCSRRTNHALKLQTIASRNNFYRLSFFPRTIKEWNELEPGVAEAGSLAQFKSGLARTLLH
ncbi:hypothetical protein Bbelb_413890 [Branchiostoma belcheri]|nr:hypothetical protein Bbelb_413890 [Branchiostoma belcheri]